MSTRVVTRKITKKSTARYCDGCGKLIGYDNAAQFLHCGVCDRDYCKDCYGDDTNQVHEDVYMIPCTNCRETLKRYPNVLRSLIQITGERCDLDRVEKEIDRNLKRLSRRAFPTVKPVMPK